MTDSRLFFRNKFSAKVSISDGTTSTSITFIVSNHDLDSLDTESAHCSAFQPFISEAGQTPLPNRLNADIPLTSRFIVIGIFGLNIAFTGSATRRAFARLRSSPTRSSYSVYIEILQSHVTNWMPRTPYPEYPLRRPITSEKEPRKPVTKASKPNPLLKPILVETKPPTRSMLAQDNVARWRLDVKPKPNKPLPRKVALVAPRKKTPAEVRSKSIDPTSVVPAAPQVKVSSPLQIQHDDIPSTGPPTAATVSSTPSLPFASHLDTEILPPPPAPSDEQPESVETLPTVHSATPSRFFSPFAPVSPPWFSPEPPIARSSTTAVSTPFRPPRTSTPTSEGILPTASARSIYTPFLPSLPSNGRIMILSIKEFIAIACLGHHTQGSLYPLISIIPVASEDNTRFNLSFNTEGISEGTILVGIEIHSYTEHKKVNNNKKTCVFGCLPDGFRQHLSSTRYQHPPCAYTDSSVMYSHLDAFPP
jgi:hypothetical protein